MLGAIRQMWGTSPSFSLLPLRGNRWPWDESSVLLPSLSILFPSFLYGSLAENDCVAIAPSRLPQIQHNFTLTLCFPFSDLPFRIPAHSPRSLRLLTFTVP